MNRPDAHNSGSAPIPFKDVGGGPITYVDSRDVQKHEAIQLRVYMPKR